MEEDWERPQYEAGGGDASVLLVVFGPKPEPLRITSLAHRVVPMDLSLELEYQEPHAAAALLDSPFGATLLEGWEGEEPPVLTADGCMVMRAEVPDPKDLRYLRNCVGVATAILEAGGRAVANLQSLGMFTPEQWRGVIFAPDKPQPRLHVNVFHGEGSYLFRRKSFSAPSSHSLIRSAQVVWEQNAIAAPSVTPLSLIARSSSSVRSRNPYLS